MKKLGLALVLLAASAAAQIPSPPLPITGALGSGGSYPLLNAGTLVFATDANHTMAYPEMSAYVIKVISSVPLTVTRNLYAPLGFFSFVVENATTGGQAIQVIGTSGIGVTIPNGSTYFVVGDGTNYVGAGSGGTSAGVSSINGLGGAFTFSGAGVSCASTICTFASGAAGSVLLAPLATQAITQPGGTTFSKTQTNTTTNSVVANSETLYQYGQSYDLGNAGISTHVLHYNGWVGTSRGNNQIISSTANNFASGDVDLFYNALLASGGCLYPSDECGHMTTDQMHQAPIVYGPVVTPQIGLLAPAFSATASGNTYIWVGGGSSAATFQGSGTLVSVSATFAGTVTAGTGYVGVATVNGNNSYTFGTPTAISVAGGSTSQTWTPAGITLVAGQTLYIYPGPGNTLAGTSIGGAYVAGVPTAGTFAASVLGSGGALFQAVLTAPTTGATNISITPSVYGYNSYNIVTGMFSDASILIDATKQSSTYGTGTLASRSTSLGFPSYTMSSGTIPVSNAYGVLSGCSGSGTGMSQTPVSVTCTFTPNVSPASGAITGPISLTGNTTASSTTISSLSSTSGLVVGQTLIGAGIPYQDTIASIGAGSVVMTLAATASATGVSINVNSNISISKYFSEEAAVTSASAISGGSQTVVFLSTYPATAHNTEVAGQGGMAGAAVSNVPNGLQTGWQILASLPGNIFIVSNCVSSAGCSAGGNLPALGTAYFYPMAFVNGTNGGVPGSGQLLANTVPFATGDNLVDLLFNEYGGGMYFTVYGQNVPTDFSIPTSIRQIIHDGPYAPGYDWQISDNGTLTGYTKTMMQNAASYTNDIFDFAKVPGTAFLQIGDGPITGFTGTQIAGVYGYGALSVLPAGWSLTANLFGQGFVATTAAPTVLSGQIGYGSTTVAASFCGSLSGAAGCIVTNIGGTTRYVPYF